MKSHCFNHILYCDFALSILFYLEPRDALILSLVNKRLNELGNNNLLWGYHLAAITRNKIYICDEVASLKAHNCCKKAYYYYKNLELSRTFIFRDELINIFITWSFRFKESAGVEWIRSCPWRQGKSASTCHFDDDQTLLLNKTKVNDTFIEDITLNFNTVRIIWKLIWKPGHYYRELQRYIKYYNYYCNDSINYKDIKSISGNAIQLTVNRVKVPTYSVFPSPTNNGGWILESCWGLYTSFPMPLIHEATELEDNNLKVTVDDQETEIDFYNHQIILQ